MILQMPGGLGEPYKSQSQKARVVSEAWGAENLYCANCSCNRLARLPTNTRAVDFKCRECDSLFQLKCQSRTLGGQIADAGFQAMCQAISQAGPANLFALHYSPEDWLVRNLIVVPRFAFSMSSIRKRNPLRPQARRHGHVLCTIMLSNFPSDAKISLVTDGRPTDPKLVREQYARLRPLENVQHDARGWTLDVLNIVRRLEASRRGTPGRAPTSFTLAEVYQFADELARLHPKNKFIEPKIRQQLQILRDMGFVKFLGRGMYRG